MKKEASLIKVALTQTCNAYPFMPSSLEELDGLSDRLVDIRKANLAHHIALIAASAEQGAQIVGLGELFTAPYFALSKHEMWCAMAEEIPNGETTQILCETAKKYNVVLTGSLYEVDNQKRYNTSVVIDSDGSYLGCYRKVHIPNGSNEQGVFSEAFYFHPSDCLYAKNFEKNIGIHECFPVYQTSFARIGVAICYDRHFEGVMRYLKAGGAEIVFSPAVTFGEKSERMWEHEFIVDACRHRLFIAGSNRKGRESPWNQEFFGKSYIAGPEGNKLLNESLHPLIVLSDVAIDSLYQADPSGWNLQSDQRI